MITEKIEVFFYLSKYVILLPMKTLQIYPTSRAIRQELHKEREHNTLLPTLMRIDDFERRAIVLPKLTMIDALQRRLLLQEASHFDGFDTLKINRDLVRFFTKSDAIFGFFEELSHENVSFADLVDGDAYIEFGEHIDVLEALLENYKRLLVEKGFIDRVFVPQQYNLNIGFVESYDRFEFYLEGYLSYFELSLIEKIAEHRPFIVHMQTSKFNQKVQDRFLEMGIELPKDSMVSFDLSTNEILSHTKTTQIIKAKVFAVEERLAQIPLIFNSVQQMVNDGISPEDIVVILPDEKLKEHLHLYDKLNNLNFAMGFDYSHTRAYKRLEAIESYWKSFSDESRVLLKKYAIEQEKLQDISSTQEVTVEQFFNIIEVFDLDLKRTKVEERYHYFRRIFKEERRKISLWLFLWLKELHSISLDDVRGGKITVMGALETRGVAFRGVVVVDFNDGVVPSIPAKDTFLNSSLRKFANLPTKNDREALQKQIYKRLLESAQSAVIIYSLSSNKVPTGYLYELGLSQGELTEVDLSLMYDEKTLIKPLEDPIIENFNAMDITWSATRLKSFLTCRRKYYYTYVKKLKVKEEDDLNEGQFLHKLLEELFREKSFFASVDEMQSNLDRLLDKLLKINTPKISYTKLLWRAKMVKFIEKQVYHFKAGWRVSEREKQIVGEIAGMRFKGVVDRVDQTDTHTMILDYKSGSLKEANRTKNLEKLTDFQMSIYSELLKTKYQNIELAFVELFGAGEIVPITQLEEKSELLLEKITEIKEMSRVVATRCEEVSRCQYCEFTLLCERGVYL